MWRDILIIAAFVLAGLMYFGLTPRRLSKYAETAKAEITKRGRIQKAFLFLMIALTLIYIFAVIWRLETTELSSILLGTGIFIFAWCTILTDSWKLSERGEKVVDVVARSVMLPLLVAGIILSDMLLWQKIVYPLAGFGVGFGLHRLVDYIDAKLKSRLSSKETNKANTTTK